MIVDLFLVYSFIKRLATPFEEWPAFKLGIIDKDGNQLKKRKELRTTKEQDALGLFDVMILKLKKLLAKIPGGQTRIASYAAALWLIKEGKDHEQSAEDLTEDFIAEQLNPYFQYITESQDVNKRFEEMLEDMGGAPATSAGAGAIAGIGVGPDGEPGISKAVQRKLQKKNRSIIRR